MTTIRFIGSGEIGGTLARLRSRPGITSSELLARYLPGAAVVKAFNNIYYKHLSALTRPAGAADRSFLLIAGTSAAKTAVRAFIESIGYGVLDAGTLADSWRQETGTPVWGTPYGPYSDEGGHPARKEVIAAALAAVTR